MTKWLKPQSYNTYVNMLSEQMSENFFERCWDVGLETYQQRLKAIGFEKMRHVLDAGCGIGQWTTALASQNDHVTAVDLREDHLNVTSKVLTDLDYANFSSSIENIENTSFKDSSFSGIFCFSVIYMTHYLKVIKEFSRILELGGMLYLKSNDLGRYIHMIVEEPNKSQTYSPRDIAINAIKYSLGWNESLDVSPEMQIIIPIEKMISVLNNNGFEVVEYGPDGSINLSKDASPESFYQDSYFGELGPYEILARKIF